MKSATLNTALQHFEFHLKQSTFKFRNEICLQKNFLGTEIKKTISTFGINTIEYPLVPSFISNKALWRFRTKFSFEKGILEAEFKGAL